MKAQLKNGQVVINGRPAIIPVAARIWLEHQPAGTEAFVPAKAVIFGMSVPNGMSYGRTGHRCLVIDSDGTPTPVVGITQHGYISERCTHQVYRPEEGDRILSVVWGGEYRGTPTIMVESPDPAKTWKAQHAQPWSYDPRVEESLLDWLLERAYDPGRAESYLPIPK